MYHGIQKKIVTNEWLIKETKVKAQDKDYIYDMNIMESFINWICFQKT